MNHGWTESIEPPVTDVIGVASGQRLAVAVWPGGPQTFVFAPGLTSNNRNIAGVAALLDGSVTVVAVDLRGRGDSTKPGPGGYGIDRHADDLLGLMDVLGIDRAVVGGHSMGAYVATAVQVAAPERCSGLAMIDGGVLVTVPGMPDPDTLLEAALKPVVDRLDMRFSSLDDYRAHLEASPYFEMGPIAERYLRHDLGVVPGGYRPKCSRVAATEDWRDLLVNPATIDRLRHVSGPVLVIRAEQGIGPGQPPVLGDAHMGVLRGALGGDVEDILVPGTTHHSITLSEPGARAVAGALSGFLSGVPG